MTSAPVLRPAPDDDALIQLRGVKKIYGQGESEVRALAGIDFDISRGDFVAIMGTSGSGKSTCMNILGCLDVPSEGTYRLAGVDTHDLHGDGLTLLRRHYIGFVFQGFNLLSRTSALENVELPLVYRRVKLRDRRAAALRSLELVGLSDRADHTPQELSGGQQQRVAIARALVTDPELLLADEPTGNLDSARTQEIMELLVELNRARGITIVMVTHEPDVAAFAHRVVVFRDGLIVEDFQTRASALMFLQTVLMALREIRRNTLRSVLTMLGVVIGVGAVIALVSVGRGATQKVTEDISKLGKNLLMVSAGARVRGGASSAAQPLNMSDMQAISREISGVHAVAPGATSTQQVIFGNKNASTQVTGTDNNFFEVRGYAIDQGRTFTKGEAQSGLPVCVLGSTVKTELFGTQDPINSAVRVGKVSCLIIGTLVSKGTAGMGQDQDDLLLMPLSAFQRRITGNIYISLILVSAEEGLDTSIVAESIRALLRQRRHLALGADDDFNVRDMAEIADTVTSTTNALTALLGAIAAVSLLVGGIGIMNIMLVSVTERTREIGIRLAIGAFAGEVMMQFLLEAIVLSTMGGIIGVILGLIGSFFAARSLALPFVIPPEIVALAFAFSALVGVLFGYLPARKAAQLNPIEALRHE